MKKPLPSFPFFVVLVLLTASLRLSAQDIGPVAQPDGPGPVAQPASQPQPDGPGPLAQPNNQGPVSPVGPVSDTAGTDGSAAMAGSDNRPANGRTVIESMDGANFDNISNSADFSGNVVVHDPQFDLTCDKLHVVLRPDRKGMKQVIATGRVVVTQEKKNDRGDILKSIGKCGKATYDPATGDVTLEDWPQVQQGINNQIATEQTTIMILNAKGRSRTIGSSRTMIVDQGQKSITP